MNILPKKSWHVRNKDNVARVRRDEAKALEEEKEVAKRKALAEQEARISILRERAKAEKRVEKEAQWDLPQEPQSSGEEEVEPADEYTPLNTAYPPDKHINLFEDFEQKKKSHGSNKEYEDEKRKAQEAYEKKIGYLTYLGQSASSSMASKPWYEQAPDRSTDKAPVTKMFSEEEALRAADPLLSMKGYLDKKKQAEDIYYGRTKQVSLDLERTSRRHHRKSHDCVEQKVTSAMPSDDSSKVECKDDKKKHKHKKSKKRKKNKKSRDSSPEEPPPQKKPSMEDLRAARYQREAEERLRSIDMVSRLQGYSTPARSVVDERTLTYNTGYMPRNKR